LILYVNGDSHSLGVDAGGIPFSYGKHLSDRLNATFICHAYAGGSNDRIIRTTKNYLKNNTPNLIIIGWSTWDREEWFYDNQYYQINSSGHSKLPQELVQKYKQWVIDEPSTRFDAECRNHQKIWDLHLELSNKEIPHVFFNTYQYFFNTVAYQRPKFDWGTNFINPYTEEFTYYYWLQHQKFKTVSLENYHYGADAQKAWADFLVPYLTTVLKDSIITK